MESALEFGGFLRDNAHYLPARIYYADTDFSGVVYHGRYIEFMERGRTEFMRALGIMELAEEDRAKGGEPLFFAVSSLSIRYKAPARIDDLLTVETRAEKMTGARLFLRQNIYRGATLLSEAECCLVMINAEGRPRPLPDSLRKLLPAA